MDVPKGRQTIELRPRRIAVIGLLFGALGMLGAILLAATGPQGPAGAYIASVSVPFVLRIVAVLIGVAAVIAVLTERSWAIALMLWAALFLVGYLAGYFYSQGLGIWYPTS
jgi:hypothetical protein